MVDPARITVILNLEALRSVKPLHATLGHTRYYRKFIKGYAQIIAPMENLLKKDVTFCWNEECKKSLDVLKEKMVTTILVFPDWKKEFHVHVDTSCIALGAVLTKDGGGDLDHPIAFTSRRLSKAEKNYSTTELEGLAMVYAIQKFRHYLLGGHFKMYTDHSALNYLVNKPMLGGESAEFERSNILIDAHGGTAGGHYARRETAQKILRAGLWWPTLHQDSKAYCKVCDVCQRTGRPSQRDELPLNPQMTLQPFEKWAIDFVGPIQPQGKTGVGYIITVTEYLTQWAKAQPMKDCTNETAAKFFFEYVLTQFGCPNILMSDHGTHFLNEMIGVLTEEFQVYHQKSMPYHAHSNRTMEEFSKVLENVLTKVFNTQ
eukprot:PITA_07839